MTGNKNWGDIVPVKSKIVARGISCVTISPTKKMFFSSKAASDILKKHQDPKYVGFGISKSNNALLLSFTSQAGEGLFKVTRSKTALSISFNTLFEDANLDSSLIGSRYNISLVSVPSLGLMWAIDFTEKLPMKIRKKIETV